MSSEGGGASRTTDPALGTSTATDVSLREFMEARIAYVMAELDALRREMTLVSEAANEAIKKADSATEKRFEGVNEFRAQLSDQAASFVTREALESYRGTAQALYDRNRADIEKLSSRLDLREGQEAGSRLTASTLFASLAALGTIITIIVVVVNVLVAR